MFDKGLYGLRSSGARFHKHLSDFLRKIGFLPSNADSAQGIRTVGNIMSTLPDMLMTPLYSPNILCRSLREVLRLHILFKVLVYYQSITFGRHFKVQKRDGEDTITVFAKPYISNVGQWIEKLLNIQLKSYETQMASDDHTETNDSGLLNNDDDSRYWRLAGCGQWAVTLGRFDVMYTIQTMA